MFIFKGEIVWNENALCAAL